MPTAQLIRDSIYFSKGLKKDENGNWYFEGSNGQRQYGDPATLLKIRSWIPDGGSQSSVPPPTSGGGGGGGGRGRGGRMDYPNVYSKTPPDPYTTKQHKRALANYVDYTKWKQKELRDTINQYRVDLPRQIAAYKEAQYGSLPEQGKQMWGNMHTNLQKRGLEDSGSFLGGARNDYNNWEVDTKRGIEDAAQAMKQQGQQTLLAALGKPDYAQNYGNWVNFDKQLNDFFNNRWANRGGRRK